MLRIHPVSSTRLQLWVPYCKIFKRKKKHHMNHAHMESNLIERKEKKARKNCCLSQFGWETLAADCTNCKEFHLGMRFTPFQLRRSIWFNSVESYTVGTHKRPQLMYGWCFFHNQMYIIHHHNWHLWYYNRFLLINWCMACIWNEWCWNMPGKSN